MLKQYLKRGILLADEEEKALFVELLKLEDDELVGVLMGDLEVAGLRFWLGRFRAFAVVSD